MHDDSVELDLTGGRERLYIFFGGIAAGIAMPPFEFYNSAKLLEHDKVFIRDFKQCWYQCGLPRISNDPYSTCDYLHSLIQKIAPKRCIFVGNSMGGFAAIMFHALLGVGEAIAFAPQTFISPLTRLRYRDRRWTKQLLKAYALGVRRRKIWDLMPLVLQMKPEPSVRLYVSKDDRLDRVHAEHLKDISGIRILEVRSGGHEIVRSLRDNGQLPAIMSGEYGEGMQPAF